MRKAHLVGDLNGCLVVGECPSFRRVNEVSTNDQMNSISSAKVRAMSHTKNTNAATALGDELYCSRHSASSTHNPSDC
jgi:hypothetical protein